MQSYAVKSSDVRDRFSEFIDTVIHKNPQLVSRNKGRDNFLAINVEHLEALITGLQFTVHIESDENGSLVGYLDEIEDLVASGESELDTLCLLAADLVDYAEEYFYESFALYFNSPNRKHHFPFVLKVMIQNDIEEVIKLFNVKHE